jgi:hypothetical protein
MGRTGTLYAIEQEGVVPDIVTIAKGLGGGYQPIGAVLAHERVVAPIRDGSGAFQHGHTYIAHATAAAAALAVQRVIRRDGLLGVVRDRGRYLERALAARFDGHPPSAISPRPRPFAASSSSPTARRRRRSRRLRLPRVKRRSDARGPAVPDGRNIDGVARSRAAAPPSSSASPTLRDRREVARAIDAAVVTRSDGVARNVH